MEFEFSDEVIEGILLQGQPKRIGVFGSTGSIGTQTLDVIRANPNLFKATILTAHSNYTLLIKQALEFLPDFVLISDTSKYLFVKEALWNTDIEVFAGEEALEEVAAKDCYDFMMAGIVGFAGLKPTLKAISSGKAVALANKETLVVAGELVTRLAKENGVNIYPVDSEHSAIFQCLVGEYQNKIEKIYLTASGGPFRGWTLEQLKDVKKEQALKHPNWTMGAKITIDSASLMNKGLEVIEAKWLFNLTPDEIDVIVHPQSIVHSLVQFEDGSMKAQMGLPDMKLPIQFALTFPARFKTDFPRFNFMDYPQLTFEKPDRTVFKNLDLAYRAMEMGGTAACALNAANEIAVEAFLNDQIGFLDIANINEATMMNVPVIQKPVYEDFVKSDAEARAFATALVTKN